MDTKISVIVPAFNIENYIERCAKSVLAQTYRNIELVIVDDGSTDNTATIIDRLANENAAIKVYHKPNGGVTSARLYGVQHASGEWIGFVDGDDEIEVDMYERLLRNAIKYAADISHCGYQMVFPNGRIDCYYNTGLLAQQDKTTALKELLSGSRIEPGLCNKLFHKALFHSLLHDNSMPMDIKINEDILMNYFLFKEAKQTVYEDFCPYHYILRKGSAATSKLNEHKLKDPIRVMQIILNDSEKMPEVFRIAEERLITQFIGISILPIANQKELVKPFRKEIRNELRRRLLSILSKSYIKKSIKIKVVWVSIWPASYKWIHDIYAKVTGLDRKYSVE